MVRKQSAERRFRHKVDIPLPPSGSLGDWLLATAAWCHRRFPQSKWAFHAHSEGERDDAPLYMRFYFAEAAMAEAFRQAWPEEQRARARVVLRFADGDVSLS